MTAGEFRRESSRSRDCQPAPSHEAAMEPSPRYRRCHAQFDAKFICPRTGGSWCAPFRVNVCLATPPKARRSPTAKPNCRR
ncbi:hypothetical protein XH92_05100 [Bradyrhizobium sp. CCBAU 53421]|nr:hypothetical protein XH92_05100 [Bradyrhizobium sp. CCBAU 53421]